VDVHDSILKLKELTARLPILPNLVAEMVGMEVTYAVEDGEVTGEGLIKNEYYAVQRAFGKKGSKFSLHYHPDKTEYVILVKGTGTVNGEQHKTPYCFTALPGVAHDFVFETYCEVIAVIIPSSEGYPNGKV
jgi:quercetin dioxygenase-like cupin family protein